MKVIAIRDSYFNDGTKPTDKAIHKGSIYHVIGERFDPRPSYFLDTGSYHPNGVTFYEVLEQGGSHLKDIFLELPDDLFETEEVTEQEHCYN